MENNQDLCQITCVHEEVVEEVITKLPQDEQLIDLADFFKSFADVTRIKMIAALQESELCVCDLANVIGLSQSAVSHQLRVLRQQRLVKYKKVGKIVYYSLDDEHVSEVMKQGLSHIKHK